MGKNKKENKEEKKVDKVEMPRKVFDMAVGYLLRQPYCEVKELLSVMDASCVIVKPVRENK